jgi:nucleoside-diphosphate-sugar epimerase
MPPRPLVAVAGSTGWLGGHVVDALLQRGVRVLALARPSADTARLEQAAAAAGDAAALTLARLDLTQTDAAHAVAHALTVAAGGEPIAAVINCVGVRDLAIPDAAIKSVLMGGTLALWRGAAAARSARFVTIAGGIHRNADGTPNRAMVHNAAREAALDVASAEVEAATTTTATTAAPPPPPSLHILDASVFWKDAQTIFDMIARSTLDAQTGRRTRPPALTLIAGGWDVRCNPISGRDLAGALVAAALDAAPPPAAAGGSGGGVHRRTVGGPEVLDFGGLADSAARALGWEACRRRSLPRPVARVVWGLARAAGHASVRALGLARFMSFLWVVCTDASPGGLVGEVAPGSDRVSDFFAELGKGQQRDRAGREGC